MKILILTVSAGNGHNAMSAAVSEYLRAAYPDTEIKQLDLFKDGEQTQAKKRANWMVNDGYFKLVKIALKLANGQFEKLKERDNRKKAATLRRNFIRPARRFVEQTVNEFAPDAVFCAHTYAAILMNDLRTEGNENALRARIVTVVSDYDVAPYTELLTELDYIVTPTDDFDDVLLKKGFDLKKRLSLGIPVHRKFSEDIDRIEARKQIGIDPDKHTVMIMSGMVGFGNITKTILNLNKCKSDFQIVCVCGKNAKVKKQLETLKREGKLQKPIRIYGFATNVDVIMSAADVLIGKIGGVAIAEAFNKHLPIIANKELPFQEYDNMTFLKARGACDYIAETRYACRVVDAFFTDTEKLQRTRDAIERIRKPDASKDIGDLLYQGPPPEGELS